MNNFEQPRNTLVVVDAQNDFITGSLAIEGSEATVERINNLTRTLTRSASNLIVTTQDWHPEQTAHFAATPNYINTWPSHCVQGTPGAELHSGLLIAKQPELATRFIKGDAACESPEDDTSYTGALAYDPTTGRLLPDFLKQHSPDTVYVAGLALGDGAENPLCVDSTARDLHEEGFNVAVVTDATEAVLPKNRDLCFRNLARRGIRLMTTQEAVAAIEERL